MHYINGTPRDQLFLFNNCLDNIIEEDNPVRVIEMEIVKNNNEDSINIIVPDKKEVNKNKKKKDKVPSAEFEIDNFEYDKNKDVYICPRKKELKKTHKNPGTEKSGRKVFEYH